MDVRAILEKMGWLHDSDLELLFNAILNSKLPSSDYKLGEAKALKEFKETIIKNNLDK